MDGVMAVADVPVARPVQEQDSVLTLFALPSLPVLTASGV